MILEDANRKLGKPVRERQKTKNDVVKAATIMGNLSSSPCGRGGLQKPEKTNASQSCHIRRAIFVA